MKLLAVDTATEACSVALLVDGELSQRYQVAPREHSHLVLTMIDELLQQAGLTPAELDCLAFGRGPGSFMGIRIATGVIQGIGFAHELPVVPVSTLAAIALNAWRETGSSQVLTAIDARMNEVYWAAYRIENEAALQLVIAETVIAPGDVSLPEQGEWLGAGTGWDAYRQQLEAVAGSQVRATLPGCLPSAAAIATLAVTEYERGNVVEAARAVPVYLRDNVAAKPRAVG